MTRKIDITIKRVSSEMILTRITLLGFVKIYYWYEASVYELVHTVHIVDKEVKSFDSDTSILEILAWSMERYG